MNPTNAVATVLTSASALDTNDDALETFDSTATHMESEVALSGPALLELAQRAVAERDALRGEVVRLREALTKSEANARRGHGSSREIAELREAVELREREVRRLKDANVARERLLVDARVKLDEALAARQAAVVRLEVRDRAANEAESQRDAALIEAAQWKKKFDAVDSELHRALAAERALSGTNDDARLQLSEAERTITGLRAELAETRQALTELDAVASRREIEHRAELSALDHKARARDAAHEREIDRLTREAKEREESHRDEVSALNAKHGDELDTLIAKHLAEVEERAEQRRAENEQRVEQHRAEIDTLTVRMRAEREGRELALLYVGSERLDRERHEWHTEKRSLRAELRASLDDTDRLREEHALDLTAWKARNSAERESGEAAIEGCHKGWTFRYAELCRELELERAARMCEATRQGHAMNSLREANEFATTALRARLSREQERAKKAEDELSESARVRDEAAVIVGEIFAALDARIERLDSERAQLRVMFDECEMTREALAQETVDACKRATEARAKSDELEREFDARTRQMAELVGNLTRATVEQHAIAGALKRGRVLPTMADVDAALLAVSRRVPEHMSAVLWGARDAIAAAIFAAADPSPLS